MGENLLEKNTGIFTDYGTNALIVTGPHVAKSDMVEQVTRSLRHDNIKYAVFCDITGEPTDVMIGKGIEAYKKNGCDFVIGIGGGSPLDSAKAIAAMITNPGGIASYNGKVIENAIPPVVAIPTTAGTGSEATKFTIITDTKRGIKMLLKGDVLLPRLAIVDYGFGMSSPRKVTVATGLDALTHAIESFISRRAMPLTDSLAISAVCRIMEWLPIAVEQGDNKEARKQMAIAALEAGICINNSSVTVVHGMSRPIGALFHVPHGISNAMLLNVCLRDMLDSATERFATLGHAIGIGGTDDSAVANAFINAVSLLCTTCEVPTLEQYGIGEDTFVAALDKMAEDAVASGSPGNAPKTYTASDCRRLYIEAFK